MRSGVLESVVDQETLSVEVSRCSCEVVKNAR
jgi:hypothetical protein